MNDIVGLSLCVLDRRMGTRVQYVLSYLMERQQSIQAHTCSVHSLAWDKRASVLCVVGL